MSSHLRAIEVVTARSTGGWLDPGLRVTLNFHPDRIGNGVPILVSLAADGVYRSLFETGTSNGVLTACRGGADDQDLLDDDVEAQVHGAVVLARDVEALVLDPCFRGTDVEAQVGELSCPVEWHDGFRLGAEELVRHPSTAGCSSLPSAWSWRRTDTWTRGS